MGGSLMSRHYLHGAAWQRQRRRILARDRYICFWCGTLIPPREQEVDHLTSPLLGRDAFERGRLETDDNNCVAAHRRCNRSRASGQAAEIHATMIQVSPLTRPMQVAYRDPLELTPQHRCVVGVTIGNPDLTWTGADCPPRCPNARRSLAVPSPYSRSSS
jgi:hypothetical protein